MDYISFQLVTCIPFLLFSLLFSIIYIVVISEPVDIVIVTFQGLKGSKSNRKLPFGLNLCPDLSTDQ